MPEEKKELQREEKLSGAVRMKSPFLAKLENFWYHYKWPFLIGIFALVVLIVCLVQCTGNGKGDDAYMMYAGGKPLTPNGYREVENSMQPFLEDRNGDGKLILAMQSYAIYTEKEIRELSADAQAHAAELTYNNQKAFEQDLEGTLCFLAEWIYEKEAKADGLVPLSELMETLPEGVEVISVDGVAYGVRLSSLPIYALPGFSEMREDTVLCMRRRPLYAEEKLYEANTRLFSRLVNAQ